MKRMIIALALLAASPALAEGEFAAGSKAKSWNLQGQENALFEGKVVDALCAHLALAGAAIRRAIACQGA